MLSEKQWQQREQCIHELADVMLPWRCTPQLQALLKRFSQVHNFLDLFSMTTKK